MNVLVLSPCSKDKRYDPIVNCEGVDELSREKLVQEHPESSTTAAEMYTGNEHQHIKTAVGYLRRSADVDWYIISAGFGLLHYDTKIPSYECGFSDIKSVRTRAKRAGYDINNLTNDEMIQIVGREKAIPQEFRKVLGEGYDLLFVVLSKPYVLSVTDALTEIPEQTVAFALASKGSKQFIGDCTWIPATETERRDLETTWMEVRGKRFLQIVKSLSEEELEQMRYSGSDQDFPRPD